MFKSLFHQFDTTLNKVGVIITEAVSSMWCALMFAFLALFSLPAAIRGGQATLVTWIAQTFLQLVLLSVIMVGQEVQGQRVEARDIAVHDTVMASHREILGSHVEMHTTLIEQNDVLARQDEMLAEIHGLLESIPSKGKSK